MERAKGGREGRPAEANKQQKPGNQAQSQKQQKQPNARGRERKGVAAVNHCGKMMHRESSVS